MKGFNGSAVILNWTRKGLHRGSTHNSEVFENSGSAAWRLQRWHRILVGHTRITYASTAVSFQVFIVLINAFVLAKTGYWRRRTDVKGVTTVSLFGSLSGQRKNKRHQVIPAGWQHEEHLATKTSHQSPFFHDSSERSRWESACSTSWATAPAYDKQDSGGNLAKLQDRVLVGWGGGRENTPMFQTA